MKTFIFIIILLSLSACGGGGSSDSNANPLFYQQWSINYNSNFYLQNEIDEEASINAQNVFKNFTGKGVKVAIIDDGFDITHPEIKDRIIKTVSVDDYGFVGSDVSHLYTTDYHGTSVSGIVAAADNSIGIMGVAPDAELILIRYPENFFSDDIVIKLFQEAVDAGADVINCSWGTYNVSDTVRDYINEIGTNARDGKGVIVVFASGNDNIDIEMDESSIKSVIAVGATDKENLRTYYSNYGKDLDIVAPGGYGLGITTIDVVGTYGGSNDGYIRYDEYKNGESTLFSGTSASAPIITGVIALGLEKDNTLTRAKVQDLLKYSTTTIGRNTPYIDDMISSASSTPSITGIYGKSGEGDFSVRVISNSSNTIYGPYSVDSIGNNEWSATVTESLPNGFYSIEVIGNEEQSILATDTSFEINTQKNSLKNKTKRKSDFYGYGKIDLEKFISNI